MTSKVFPFGFFSSFFCLFGKLGNYLFVEKESTTVLQTQIFLILQTDFLVDLKKVHAKKSCLQLTGSSRPNYVYSWQVFEPAGQTENGITQHFGSFLLIVTIFCFP